MELTPFCLMLTCLRVIPDRSQFFRYDSVSLSCEEKSNSTPAWKVKRETLDGGVTPCSNSWGSTTCVITNTYPSDSGLYWCESEAGDRSNAVNITITDRAVLLDSPALPVSEGDPVTLRCKAQTNSSDQVFHFSKDGGSISIGSSSAGEMTIHRVSKSDEGFYRCSVSGGGESVGSWLAVEASLQPSTSAPSTPAAPSSSANVSRIICHVVVGTPYLLSTILLGLIYRDRKRAGRTVAERRGSNDVIMEIVV